ncbi:peptidylprolyl isomerase [Brevundimonas sp. M20]|uniref:peptidylprolyl isomerase n=1 Tax=Brevundimonas sp. M20 TaxID=2591463 RepID=UPI001146FF04|nr:peptidylprolyl isomerase [Brevundimonas sp. M20]QDH73824.1 peptidylprolyl isomerase [Brevundimonas sp. M20]
MRFNTIIAAAAAAVLMTAAAPEARSQTAPAPAAGWRTIAPENLLVIDTSKGRIIAEMDPRLAPRSVERVRTLANRGFYDGLKWHRVIEGFMAQGGDPLGTGEGGSELPDLQGEFSFRRGRADGFVSTGPGATGASQLGVIGSMAVETQPDAQMMITADFKTDALALFCTGVLGMARAGDPNSANSQFFVMTAPNDALNSLYTPFGRVLSGLDAARALKAGDQSQGGRVTDPDLMTRVRTASALPEGERPTARVMTTNSPAFTELLASTRTRLGRRFNVCEIQPTAEVTGG